jgi:hypothetical protein
MNRDLLERASRMFNSVADLRTEEDQRINEWFKRQLASYDRCAVCDRAADHELHYVGTVDSHEFRLSPSASEAPSGGSVPLGSEGKQERAQRNAALLASRERRQETEKEPE